MSEKAKGKFKEAPVKADQPKQDVQVRNDDGRLIYSAGGTDLICRDPAHPHFYELLTDCAAYGYLAGTMRILSEPFDEGAVNTARDMARSLGLLE